MMTNGKWAQNGIEFLFSNHLQDKDTQCTIQCLGLSSSKVMKEWKETDKKITFCYNEARDNSKFIQAIENSCHALYLDDPVNMKESILGLLQTVRLIYSVSQFYNTSERTSSLMVKVKTHLIFVHNNQYQDCHSYAFIAHRLPIK